MGSVATMTNAPHLAAHKNKPTDYRRAKRLRHDPTNGEQVLWYQLRLSAQISNFRFRRQHPLHPYIVDFVCLKLRLVVEVDGCSHDTRLDKDKRRDENLMKMGYEVLRFSNEEVMRNHDGVVLTILNRANEILDCVLL